MLYCFSANKGAELYQWHLAFAQYVVCEKVNGRAGAKAPEASLFGFDEPAKEVNLLLDSCGECSSCTKAKH